MKKFQLLICLFISILFISCTSCQQNTNSVIISDNDSLDFINTQKNDTTMDTLPEISFLNFIGDTINNIPKSSPTQLSLLNDTITYFLTYYHTYIKMPYKQINSSLIYVESIKLTDIDNIEASEVCNTGYALYYKTDEKFYFSNYIKQFTLVSGTSIENSTFLLTQPIQNRDSSFQHIKVIFSNDSLFVSHVWNHPTSNISDSDWSSEVFDTTAISMIKDSSNNTIGFRSLNSENKDNLSLFSKHNDSWYFHMHVVYGASVYKLK